jgi:hypothetical protein
MSFSPRPNFFIIGAPRCGSTALTRYLSSHPDIFIPLQKESHYFADDFHRFREVSSLDAYARLFKAASAQAAIGEASVYYLYSEPALRRIDQFDNASKIIVLVRNPIDMLYSFHRQLLATYHEDESDFPAAWQLQESRSRGERIPQQCLLPQMLQYATVGRLGERVDAVLRHFGADRVHVILFDDFVADTPAVYRQTLGFLGVPDDDRSEFPRINQNRNNRIPRLEPLMRRPGAWMVQAKQLLRNCVGNQRYAQLTDAYLRLFTTTEQRAPLPEEFVAELADEFRADIGHLSDLLKRDLSGWLNGAARPMDSQP